VVVGPSERNKVAMNVTLAMVADCAQTSSALGRYLPCISLALGLRMIGVRQIGQPVTAVVT
ncbi:MAG: hypothetical protein KDD75_08575, partial [Caldilineaceae bacterium]|nr:hypothetical protein [Caldilineaceae bacterium]